MPSGYVSIPGPPLKLRAVSMFPRTASCAVFAVRPSDCELFRVDAAPWMMVDMQAGTNRFSMPASRQNPGKSDKLVKPSRSCPAVDLARPLEPSARCGYNSTCSRCVVQVARVAVDAVIRLASISQASGESRRVFLPWSRSSFKHEFANGIKSGAVRSTDSGRRSFPDKGTEEQGAGMVIHAQTHTQKEKSILLVAGQRGSQLRELPFSEQW